MWKIKETILLLCVHAPTDSPAARTNAFQDWDKTDVCSAVFAKSYSRDDWWHETNISKSIECRQQAASPNQNNICHVTFLIKKVHPCGCWKVTGVCISSVWVIWSLTLGWFASFVAVMLKVWTWTTKHHHSYQRCCPQTNSHAYTCKADASILLQTAECATTSKTRKIHCW